METKRLFRWNLVGFCLIMLDLVTKGWKLAADWQEALSIGVIGGADGPTAVFFTGSSLFWFALVRVIGELVAAWVLWMNVVRYRKSF